MAVLLLTTGLFDVLVELVVTIVIQNYILG